MAFGSVAVKSSANSSTVSSAVSSAKSSSAKSLALRWLARREHSRVELERKLVRQVQDLPQASAADQIAVALDELAALGLLSDERAAQSLLEGRGARLGSRRIKHDLVARGIGAGLVAATLEHAQANEFERAQAVWQRRFGTLPAGPQERARQARFLAGRGFDGDVIRRLLKGPPDD